MSHLEPGLALVAVGLVLFVIAPAVVRLHFRGRPDTWKRMTLIYRLEALAGIGVGLYLLLTN